jgi:hypothetical protein
VSEAPEAPPTPGGRSSRRRTIVFLASFALACLVTLVFEQASEHAIEGGDARKPERAATLLDMAGIYQRIVATANPPTEPRYTAILELDRRGAGIGDTCGRRARLAAALGAAAALRPKAIVIDEYLSEACSGNPESTRQLAAVLAEAAGSMPIVVGRKIGRGMTKPTDPGEVPVPILDRMAESLLVPDVRSAIANVDVDNRKVPLGWYVLDPNTGDEDWMGSLALVGAQASRNDLLEADQTLAGLKLGDEIRNPYVSFLTRDRYDSGARVLASALLCEDRPEAECQGLREQAARRLGGKVVVVGVEDEDTDTHHSAVGTIPGFVLQANYVEALLDRRYFVPARWWVEYAVGFLVFLLLQVAVTSQHESIRRATGWRLGVAFAKALGLMALVVLATLLGIYLAAEWFRVLVNPLALGAMAIMFKVSELLFLAIHKGGGHHDEPESETTAEMAAGDPPAGDPADRAG